MKREMTAAVLLLTLAGCGQGGSSGQQAASGPAAAPPPAAAPVLLTDDQKKTLLAQLPAAYQSADLSNGQAKFAMCASCHTTAEAGADGIGPNLWGVFGRKAGAKNGFAYSNDLKSAAWTWDPDHLDKWITNPRAVLPNTKMTFAGLADPKDRTDVIAYLKVATSPAPKG